MPTCTEQFCTFVNFVEFFQRSKTLTYSDSSAPLVANSKFANEQFCSLDLGPEQHMSVARRLSASASRAVAVLSCCRLVIAQLLFAARNPGAVRQATQRKLIVK
jgi:hypothetical protein